MESDVDDWDHFFPKAESDDVAKEEGARGRERRRSTSPTGAGQSDRAKRQCVGPLTICGIRQGLPNLIPAD